MERSVMQMLPEELLKFFESEGGHSLIIKGPPGSGKTTLALEILENYRDKMDVLYISTRVADQALLNQFPWAGSIERKEPIKKIGRRNLNILEGLIEEGFVKENVEISENEAILEVGEMLPELERIYEFVEGAEGSKVMVCVDSIDGLSEKYGIEPERILYAIQKDIVEPGFGNIIFVLEETSTRAIDYLGDGIVELNHEPYGKFWKRILIIRKLRGSPIKRPRYLYTLRNGRFSTVEYQPVSLDSGIDIENLTHFMKNHLKEGCMAIYIADNFPVELVESIIISIAALSNETMIMPPVFYPGSMLERHADQYNVKVKIIGYGGDRREIYLEGSDIRMELSKDIVRYHGGEAPTLILSVDAIEQVYGDIKTLPSLINELKTFARIVIIAQEAKLIGGVDRILRLRMIEDLPVVESDRGHAFVIRGRSLELVSLE